MFFFSFYANFFFMLLAPQGNFQHLIMNLIKKKRWRMPEKYWNEQWFKGIALCGLAWRFQYNLRSVNGPRNFFFIKIIECLEMNLFTSKGNISMAYNNLIRGRNGCICHKVFGARLNNFGGGNCWRLRGREIFLGL